MQQVTVLLDVHAEKPAALFAHLNTFRQLQDHTSLKTAIEWFRILQENYQLQSDLLSLVALLSGSDVSFQIISSGSLRARQIKASWDSGCKQNGTVWMCGSMCVYVCGEGSSGRLTQLKYFSLYKGQGWHSLKNIAISFMQIIFALFLSVGKESKYNREIPSDYLHYE